MGDVTVLRNMPREQQMTALRRLLETNLLREKLVQEQITNVVREINRLKRMDAEDAGHVMEKLRG